MEFVIEKDTKVLVVTPHQDDETIGCGGFLALYGPNCDVLLLTDGRLGIEGEDEERTVEIRNKELDEACSIARVNKIYRLPIRNNELPSKKAIVKKFDIKKYDYILVPNRYEAHIDHKPVLSIFRSMKQTQKAKASIFEYEVWTPLKNPTNMLDISDVIEVKKEMLNKYVSQISGKNYVEASLGLNKYRGLAYNNEYAEAYSFSGYNEFLGKIYEKMPDNIKNIAKKMAGGK